MNKQDLAKKAKIAKEDIEFLERKGNKLLADVFKRSDWYPECHNDPNKTKCDHCMECWSIDCNRSNCDRLGRCMCPTTSCICLGR